MIEITYYPNGYELTIKGHANYARSGEDIVCSAISTLYYTLTKNLLDRHAEGLEYDDKAGDAMVRCTKTDDEVINTIWVTVITGIAFIADYYKDFVKLSVQG